MEKVGWFFKFGFSPDYRFREAGPFETFAEARAAARQERRAGWSTGRVEKREYEEEDYDG